MLKPGSLNAIAISIIFLIGCVVPFVGVMTIVLTGTEVFIVGGDSEKFYRPAFRLIETGIYGFAAEGGQSYRPDLDILPGYPLFLAAVFKIFGLGNYTAVAFVQVILYGTVTVAIALSARSFRAEWMWPAAFLAAVWPNMVVRPTTIMSETLFLFYFVWGMCALLWLPKGRYVFWLLFSTGLCFGMAYMVRPILLFFPVLVLPAIFYILKRDLGYPVIKAFMLSTIPFLVMILFTVPQYVQSYNSYGVAKFNTQRGANALRWLYPCLAMEWGCGKRDISLVNFATDKYKAGLSKLPDADKNNVIVKDLLREKVAAELISDLPLLTLVKGVVGSTLRSLLHNVTYEVMTRLSIPRVHFGEVDGPDVFERVRLFVISFASAPWMWLWMIFQTALMISRGVQLTGLLIIRRFKYRTKSLLLFSMILSFAGVSVGFGSVRYRTPMEPEFIIFTIIGWSILREYWVKWRET
jgi:hypothetical protein